MALKNLKSLFFVEDPVPADNNVNQTTNNPTVKNQPVVNQPVTNNQNIQNIPPAIPGTPVIDQRIFDSLQKALENSNMQGFDYFEFRNSLKSLSAIIPDEATRFRAVFATAASSGVTVQKLLESGNYYKEVLNKEFQKFQEALAAQVDNGVIAKQKQAEALTLAIQQKQQKIQELTQEIMAHQEEINKIQQSVTDANVKIETTKNNFQLTFQTVVSEIDNDMVSIQRYLQAPTA
jgi:hypothetical protein